MHPCFLSIMSVSVHISGSLTAIIHLNPIFLKAFCIWYSNTCFKASSGEHFNQPPWHSVLLHTLRLWWWCAWVASFQLFWTDSSMFRNESNDRLLDLVEDKGVTKKPAWGQSDAAMSKINCGSVLGGTQELLGTVGMMGSILISKMRRNGSRLGVLGRQIRNAIVVNTGGLLLTSWAGCWGWQVETSTCFQWFPGVWYVFSGWQWNKAKLLNVLVFPPALGGKRAYTHQVSTSAGEFQDIIWGRRNADISPVQLDSERFSVKITVGRTDTWYFQWKLYIQNCFLQYLQTPCLYFIFRGRNIPLDTPQSVQMQRNGACQCACTCIRLCAT